jgi:hypothetical protein
VSALAVGERRDMSPSHACVMDLVGEMPAVQVA